MAFSEKTSQPVISTKRPSDDADDCKLDEFRKPKTLVRNRKYAPPKIRVGFEAIRDFPPGCGIKHDSLESIVERKPLKKLDNVDSKDKTMKIINSLHFEDNKLNSSKPKALGFNKPSFGSKPSRKTKYWDPLEQVVHDHPPVCGIKEEKKPLQNANKVESSLKKMNSNEKEKLVDPHPCENTQRKSFKPKELVNTKPSFGSKPAGKVIPKDTITSDSLMREKIHNAMILFEKVHTQLFKENGSKQQGEMMAHWRVSVEAAKIVKQKLTWMTPNKASGEISGVHPGDMFKYRSQLHMVGLHCQQHSGIDYTEINGKNVAISVVDSHRYSNESELSDVLRYCGAGGGGVQFGFSGSNNRQVAIEDQKLERGNLALKNSIIEKSPVRVIKKLCGVGFGKKKTDMFVYDGLYTVEHYTQKRSPEGKMMFKFELHKIPGQSQSQSQPQFQKRVNANAMRGDVALYQHSTFQMLK